MKNFSILLTTIFLISCSPNLFPPNDQYIVASPTPIISQPTAISLINTPTPASPEIIPISYNLPEWINDPQATIGMTISDVSGDSFKFTFLNFGTKDSFEISASSNVLMGYFWMPDGTHFGFLASDMQTAFLVNLESGKVEQIPISENAVRFLKGVERDKFIEPLIVQDVSANDFTFLPLYRQEYSYDLSYIADYDFQNSDNRTIIVQNAGSGEITYITSPSDEFCNIEHMWSPVKSELAILRSKMFDGCGRMGMPPGERIEIYKPDGERLASFEGSFSDPTWSPDGSKILYGDKLSNSPCILDLILATKRCIREIARNHPNANTIHALSWSMDGKQIYYMYSSADESGWCVYNLMNGDIFCPTDGLQELEDFSIVRYKVSPNERFLMFHFGGSCATCDYWANPNVGIIGKDGSNFYTLGEEPLVGVMMGNSYVMFSYPMVTLLWRPNPVSIP